MIRRFCLVFIAAIVLATGTGSARWPPTLDLEWFELPDAQPIDCETRDGSEVMCASVSIEFKQFKKHTRKLLNRKLRANRVVQFPWRMNGEERRRWVVANSSVVELVFDENRGTVAVIHGVIRSDGRTTDVCSVAAVPGGEAVDTLVSVAILREVH